MMWPRKGASAAWKLRKSGFDLLSSTTSRMKDCLAVRWVPAMG